MQQQPRTGAASLQAELNASSDPRSHSRHPLGGGGRGRGAEVSPHFLHTSPDLGALPRASGLVAAGWPPRRGLPPLHVEVGALECLRDQVTAFVRRARAAGVEVDLVVASGGVHVFPLLAALARSEDDQPRAAFRRAAAFIERVTPPAAPTPDAEIGWAQRVSDSEEPADEVP